VSVFVAVCGTVLGPPPCQGRDPMALHATSACCSATDFSGSEKSEVGANFDPQSARKTPGEGLTSGIDALEVLSEHILSAAASISTHMHFWKKRYGLVKLPSCTFSGPFSDPKELNSGVRKRAVLQCKLFPTSTCCSIFFLLHHLLPTTKLVV